jgi:hypothetical protein
MKTLAELMKTNHVDTIAVNPSKEPQQAIAVRPESSTDLLQSRTTELSGDFLQTQCAGLVLKCYQITGKNRPGNEAFATATDLKNFLLTLNRSASFEDIRKMVLDGITEEENADKIATTALIIKIIKKELENQTRTSTIKKVVDMEEEYSNNLFYVFNQLYYKLKQEIKEVLDIDVNNGRGALQAISFALPEEAKKYGDERGREVIAKNIENYFISEFNLPYKKRWHKKYETCLHMQMCIEFLEWYDMKEKAEKAGFNINKNNYQV